MAIGWKNPSSRPAGRKPFHEGASTVPQGRQETIRPHQFADGQDAMGTPAKNEHPMSNKGYLEGRKENATLRGSPHPDANNSRVHSKGDRNARRNGFTPSDPRQPSQPGKLEQRDLPSGLHSREAHPPGVHAPEVVGHAVDGSGRWNDPSYPNRPIAKDGNTDQHRQHAGHQHVVRKVAGTAVSDGRHPGSVAHAEVVPARDTSSRPSGRTITK